MKNNHYTLSVFLLTLITLPFFTLNAQTPRSIVATGLKSPNGLEFDEQNRLIVVQTGSGANDGSVDYVNANGSTSPIVTGLPSFFDPVVQDLQGAWRVKSLPNNQLALVQGEGTNAYSGSVLFFDLNGFTAGSSTPKTSVQNVRQLKVSSYLLGRNFAQSNPFSVAFDAANNLYVADAAANSIVKGTPANILSLVARIPDFVNPTPVGPPMVNQVPTRIIARPNGGFFVASLSGFPFLDGKATIYALSTEGVLTPYKTGMTLLTDLAIDPSTGDLLALQFASFQLGPVGYAPNSSKIIRIKADGSTKTVADNFGPAAGMAIDANGNVFVTETFSGRILKFSNTVVENSTAFFSENFNKGIPSTWMNAAAAGSTAKFVSCDTSCLKDYDTYSFDFYRSIVTNISQNSVAGFELNTLKGGTAALKAVKQTSMDATLTSPAINCSGKNKVYARFFSTIYGGANSDSLLASGNATVTCKLRVSKDGTTWKDYKFIDFNIRETGNQFVDISDVAANQSRVFLQFRRTGDENNQIWVIDDVSLTDVAPLRNVTVAVDMSNERVSSKGVYIAHDGKDGWKPNAVKMMDMGNGIYEGTMQVAQLDKVHYKFMNGDSWGENESVPIGCGEMNAAGYHDRVVTGGAAATTVEPICFGACMSCGNRKPQSTYVYCPTSLTTIYCENFESLKEGKLIPQTSRWSTGKILGGATPEIATDIPMIRGYWSGYTNFDGSKSMRVRADFFSGDAGYDNPVLDLNDPTTGAYQIDFKMYIPRNSGGIIDFLDKDGYPGMGIYYSDSIYFATGVDPMTFEGLLTGKALSYKVDDWNDVSIMFNAATNKTTVKINNNTLYGAINADQPGYAFLEFYAIDVLQSRDHSVYFIDDIVYRRVGTQTPPIVESTPRVINALISPNPANEKLRITPDENNYADYQVRLLNSLGQVVSTQKSVGASPVEFVTQDLTAGMYIVEYQSEDVRWTKKVVVQH